MYDETIGKKGSNETVSFLHHFINNFLDKTVKTLYIFTDNCAGQNKNNLVVQYLLTVIKNSGALHTVVHHLPERGHSFLPCDRDFGIIEKKRRNKEVLYLPEEWYNFVSSCSRKFQVVRVQVVQDIIYDFKTYLTPHFKTNIVTKKKKYEISKYKIFEYNINHKNEVYVSENHSLENNMESSSLRKNNKEDCAELELKNEQLAYNSSLPIKYSKYEDLMKLAKKFIPPNCMDFYNNLKHTEKDSAGVDQDSE